MKKINIQCYDNGRASLKTKDVHIESENIASIIEVDFSQVEYKNYQKGLDIESGSYLLRYFLGNDEVVFKELTYENTLPGELVITPFVFDEVNDRKVRYLTDNSVIIHKRRSVASQDAPDNVDLMLEEIKKFLEETTDKLVVDMVFNKDTKLLSLILENGDEISTIIDGLASETWVTQQINNIDYVSIQNQDTQQTQKMKLYIVDNQIGYDIEEE